jgi:predicted transcriptional regulator
MHRGVISCSPEASLVAIARTMAAHRIHCVVVPGHGIVTDVELTAALADLSSSHTAAVLARSAPTLAPTDSLERAASVMQAAQATHAVVVRTASTGPAGVLSTLDLANALALR